jgi:hypothetical protein
VLAAATDTHSSPAVPLVSVIMVFTIIGGAARRAKAHDVRIEGPWPSITRC